MESEVRFGLNQALGKAMAFHNCGKDQAANDWANILIDRLRKAGILLDQAPMQKSNESADSE